MMLLVAALAGAAIGLSLGALGALAPEPQAQDRLRIDEQARIELAAQRLRGLGVEQAAGLVVVDLGQARAIGGDVGGAALHARRVLAAPPGARQQRGGQQRERRHQCITQHHGLSSSKRLSAASSAAAGVAGFFARRRNISAAIKPSTSSSPGPSHSSAVEALNCGWYSTKSP